MREREEVYPRDEISQFLEKRLSNRILLINAIKVSISK